MKKALMSLFIALCATMVAQAETGWLHLNNGSIVKGDITLTDTQVSVVTETGDVYTYPRAEVNKISYSGPNMPAVKRDPNLNDYMEYTRGFWIRGTVSGAYSLFASSRCTPMTEIDIAGGYRVNQYVAAGIGFGYRYYFDNSSIRKDFFKWSVPIYATVTGNIIDMGYHNVVPYYCLDLGGAIRDGFMWRPSIGIRVGKQRSAFLLSATYTGQTLKYRTGSNRYVSFLSLTLGYEY